MCRKDAEEHDRKRGLYSNELLTYSDFFTIIKFICTVSGKKEPTVFYV